MPLPTSALRNSAFLGFSGVALGAFGAHALKPTLEALGHVTTWETASRYHLLHAVALLGLAALPSFSAVAVKWVSRLWLVGVLLFSGSLYWLSLGGPRFLGPITPLGGTCLLAGWAILGFAAMRKRPTP